MGNGASRYENYAYPPHDYRPERSKYKKYRRYGSSSYEPEEVPYQYPQAYPQAYAQPAYVQPPYTVQPYTFANGQTHGFALPYTLPAPPPQAPPFPVPPQMQPNPYAVIPEYPMADMSQIPIPSQPVIPPSRTGPTPGPRFQMPSGPTMPVPEPAPQPFGGSAVPPPPVMDNFGRPPSPVIPVYPNVQAPTQPVMPQTPDVSSPGRTPLSFGDAPRQRTPHSHAHHRNTRPRWSRLFERPPSLHFRDNPLPTPPRSVIEHGHYAGLIQRLREDPADILRAKAATATGGTYLAFVSQAPGQPGVIIPRSVSPGQPKQSKGGIFRTLSNAFSRKSRKERRGESSGSTLPPIREQPPSIYSPAVPPPPIVGTPAQGIGPASAGQAPAFPMVSPVPPPAAFANGHMNAAPPMPHSPRAVSPRPLSPRPVSPRPPVRPPSLAHSHRSQRSQRSQRTHSPRPQILIDLEGAFAGLVHYSPHPVNYNGITYPSAFHMLEALRFIDEHPDISRRVSQCTSVTEVRDVVSQAREYSRPDWEHVVISKMEDVLYHKFMQHPALLDLLFNTGIAELVYNDSHDDFWGVGPRGNGSNELGKALVRLRERLRATEQ